MIKWFLDRTDAEPAAISMGAILFSGFFAQWFGQRLSHALSVRRERNAKLSAAAKDFRNAINSELFKGMQGHYLHAALGQVLPAQKNAVHEFRLHLGIFGKLTLDRAWKAYHGGEEGIPIFLKHTVFQITALLC